MSKHTLGKMTWKRRPDESLFYVIGDHKTGPHAQGDIYIDEEDLRRMAACWNACEGVDTVALERAPIDTVLRDIVAQRNELLEALREAWPYVPEHHGPVQARIKAAIAKATGENHV